MKTAALVTGLAAVALYLLSYQFPKRKAIIACNIASRVLYVLQYLLLFAFEGAAMDLSAIPSSFFAARKHTPFVEKNRLPVLLFVNAIIAGIGILAWQNWMSLVPIVGVLLETNALWLSKENQIRFVSLLSLPFWLFYNLYCGAYGSALGNILAIISIVLAMIRYDLPGKR